MVLTDLGEGDSANDDIDFKEVNNSVDEMVSDDIGNNNINNLDDAVIEELRPLCVDEVNNETGTLLLSRFNYFSPAICVPTSKLYLVGKLA